VATTLQLKINWRNNIEQNQKVDERKKWAKQSASPWSHPGTKSLWWKNTWSRRVLFLSLEWKIEGVMDGESGHNENNELKW